MGRYGSGRWGATVTRASTEGLLRLDVRALVREALLEPGKSATVTWIDGASITTHVTPNDPDRISLRYFTVTGKGSWSSPIQQDVFLTRTRCTFGGTRVWFVCPGCGARCAVLYALRGLFRCRACHNLAYASTRTSS